MSLIKHVIRTKLACTSRRAADAAIRREGERSLALLEGLSEEGAGRSVRVPEMLGIDEEMRDWSLYQVLEHNTIVNRILSMLVLHLTRGRPVPALGNPKTDVLPSAAPGPEAVTAFQQSIDRHLQLAAEAPRLRGTATHPHPIFGPLDAHRYHAFFSVHLAIHRRQMEAIRKQLG